MPKKAFSAAEIEANKIKIMDEASRVMANEGIANMSMRKLADSIGMTAANIYNYFPNKHELFLATTERGFELLNQYVSQAAEGVEHPRERLVKILKCSIEFTQQWGGYWELMFHPPISLRGLEGTPYEEIDDKMRQQLVQLMMDNFVSINSYYETHAPGQLDQVPVRAITALTSVHGMIDLNAHRILEKFNVNTEILIDSFIDSTVNLLFPEIEEKK